MKEWRKKTDDGILWILFTYEHIMIYYHCLGFLYIFIYTYTWRSTIIICHNSVTYWVVLLYICFSFLVFLLLFLFLFLLLYYHSKQRIRFNALFGNKSDALKIYIRFSFPSLRILICHSKTILWHSIENVFNTWANFECFRCITRALFTLNSTFHSLSLALFHSLLPTYSITRHT